MIIFFKSIGGREEICAFNTKHQVKDDVEKVRGKCEQIKMFAI